MSTAKEHWNNEYTKYPAKKPIYDLWLDKYKDIIETSKEVPILDLGCGGGNNSLYLSERGYEVISCDISEAAIKIVKEFVPEAEAMVLNMLEGLPFGEAIAKVIVADLSLHYFCWKDTLSIVNDIKRVLAPGGYLLCRLNSTKDVNHGAGQGDLIEAGYYDIEGKRKRFFDSEQIGRLFDEWQIKYSNECRMDRYGLPKILWEVAVSK